MKKVVTVFALVISTSTLSFAQQAQQQPQNAPNAQNAPNNMPQHHQPPSPEENAQRFNTMLTKRLSLTDEQAKKTLEVSKDFFKKQDELMKARAPREDMEANVAKRDAAYAKIFTAEQNKKFEAEMKPNRQQHGAPHGAPAPAPAPVKK